MRYNVIPTTAAIVRPSEAVELKVLNLEDFLTTAWSGTLVNELDAVDVETAYERVGIVRTAVTLRANALATLPWEITTRRGMLVDYDAEQIAILVRHIEIDVCLYGAAYLLRDPSAPLGLRRLHPRTITPKTDARRGLVGFVRRIGDTEMPLTPNDDILYLWEPSVRSEASPGIGLVATALTQARTLLAVERYQSTYFERGAIRPTVWMFAQRPTDAERTRFEQWLRQLVAGIRNAFRHLALSTEITPITLGDKITDAINPELIQRAAEVMITTFQVPMSLVFSNASNYATALRDYQAFILLTILARAREITAMLQPHFIAHNQVIRCNEARIDAVQNSELEKAEAIQRLTGGAVLTLNEARGRLDLDPLLEDTEERNILHLRRQLEIVREAVSAGLSLDDAVRLAGITTTSTEPTEAKSLKQDDDELQPHERQLYRDLLRAFQQIRQTLLDGADELNSEAFRVIITPAMRDNLASIARIFADEVQREIGITVDDAELAILLADWSDEATRHQIDEFLYPYTRDYIARAVATWRQTPGADRAELIKLIEPVVGTRRAETIAITAATEAATAGVVTYRDMIRQDYGLEYELVWETANDERVCPICGTLHQTSEDELNGKLPPAHPRCRCGVRLTRKD